MADTEKTPAMLLDELSALDPARRRELAAALRSVAETLAEVRDGKTASHTVGVLAHLLDPGVVPWRPRRVDVCGSRRLRCRNGPAFERVPW